MDWEPTPNPSEPSEQPTNIKTSGNDSRIQKMNSLSFTKLNRVCNHPDILNKRLQTYKGCNAVNLSSIQLDPHTLILLSYGLSFCPTPKRDSKALVIENIEKFLHKIKLCGFFMNNQNSFSLNQQTLAT